MCKRQVKIPEKPCNPLPDNGSLSIWLCEDQYNNLMYLKKETIRVLGVGNSEKLIGPSNILCSDF